MSKKQLQRNMRNKGFGLMGLVIGMAIIAIIGAGIIGMVAKNSEFAVASSGVQETEKISDVARKWYNRDADSDGVPDGAWPTVAQIQGSYYPGWDGNNPWGNPYNLTVSTEGILTITQTVPTKFTTMYTNRLSMASASGGTITYHVPPPGSYTENAAFVHRTGDTMDSGAEIEFAGAGGKISGLRTSDIGDPLDAINVEWYDTDVEERFEELVGQIEDGSIVAGHAAWADDAAHADDADWADSAGDALRALYANNAGHANDADNADYANSAGRADRATRADNADHADKADWAKLAEDVTNLPPRPTGTPGGGSDWSASAATTGYGELRITINNNSSSSLSFSIRFGSPFSTTKTLTIAKNSHGTTSVGGCNVGNSCGSYTVTATVTCTKDSSKKTLTGTAKKRTGNAG